MPFCKACGTVLAAGKKFCTECGAPAEAMAPPVAPPPRIPVPHPVFVPVEENARAEVTREELPREELPREEFPREEVPPAIPFPPRPEPPRQDRPERGAHSGFAFSDPEAEPPSYSSYAVMATEDYVGVMFLTMIPVVNIVLLLIWALGGTKKLNLQSYARAALIMLLIGAVLATAGFFILGSVLGDLFGLLSGYFG